MDKCPYSDHPHNCEYFPDCARGRIDRYLLKAGETRICKSPGPCLLFFRSGEGVVSCNGESLAALPGYILLPEGEFTIRTLSPVSTFAFGPDMAGMLAGALGNGDGKKVSRKEIKPVRLLGGYSGPANPYGIDTPSLGCRYYADAKFREIVYTVCMNTPARHKERIRAVFASREWLFRERVGELFGTCRTLAEFASGTGLSESGFNKRFKRVFGLSFYRWYQSRRLEEVRRDLVRPDITLKEISAKHGFCSVQHLGCVIKRLTGKTPGQLRKEGMARIITVQER